MTELAHLAAVLAVLGLLMALSVLLSRVAGRVSLPVALVFLVIGMLAGSEGVGRIAFESYTLALRLGTVTLVLILFDGGLNTPYAAIQRAITPSVLLATVGVVATAVLVALAARLIGLPWLAALLVGAIVSSTDAAAVFAVLRASGVELPRRVAATLELESGLNDPVAVILTTALTAAHVSARATVPWLALEIVGELLIGCVIGICVGVLGRWLLRHARPAAAGLLPVLSIAVAFGAFGAATIAHGSGFLATYLSAMVIGNGAVPYRSGLLRVHDAVAWLGQVVMFVVLGLLSFPTRLMSAAAAGLLLTLVLVVLARPLATLLCLLPFRYRLREIAFVGWVGLRGAVPIILAIFPVLAHVPGAERIFDVVFVIVVASTLVPGATVRWAARLLRVQVHAPPPPSAMVEIASTLPLRSEIVSYYVSEAAAVVGAAIGDVELPSEAAVMLVVRGQRLLGARPDTTLLVGDHVFVFCLPRDRAMVDLLFGRAEA